MSSGPPEFPNVPTSWFDFLTKILVIIAALTGLVNTVGNFWNNRKIETGNQKVAVMEEKQADNSAKLDAVADKAKSIDKKAGEIKLAVEK